MGRSRFVRLAALAILLLAATGLHAFGGRAVAGSDAEAPAPEAQERALLVLATQADLAGPAALTDWSARGRAVVAALRTTAAATQAPLLAQLEAGRAAGVVRSYRSHAIINAVLVEGDPAWIRQLAQDPAIANTVPLEEWRVARLPAALAPIPQTVEWGVAQVGADAVWADFDLRGAGVVVASIGTGVDAAHPALTAQYRGTASGSHDYNWYDPTGTYPLAPGDDNGHGSHTTGTILGDDASGNQIGVAPAAQWIAVKACNDFGACSQADLLAAAEWILAPTPIGAPPDQGDPDLRPHIVNITWGGQGGDPWYQVVAQAWRAAGIVPVAGVGGGGPSPGSIGSPADYPEVVGAGATDMSDIVASFSARGPSSLTTEIKPDVVAPGVNVRSANHMGGYAVYSGTSMAGAHVAGCAALLRAASPELSPEELELTLEETALDVDVPGPDFAGGHGRIDCYAAVQAAGSFVHVPGIGLWAAYPGPYGLARAVVPILDESGGRVNDATVTARWTLPSGASVSQIRTTTNGLAWFAMIFGQPGAVTLTVESVGAGDALLDRPGSVLSRTVVVAP